MDGGDGRRGTRGQPIRPDLDGARHHVRVPIYEFSCRRCGERFEELVRAGETPACPSCSAADVERLLSGGVATLRIGLRGGDARRSEAKRRAQRERAAERRRRDG
jgi:putative FmdB family regulatory protein